MKPVKAWARLHSNDKLDTTTGPIYRTRNEAFIASSPCGLCRAGFPKLIRVEIRELKPKKERS